MSASGPSGPLVIISCHLLSFKRSLLIHVDFNALTKAFRFIIFNPPSMIDMFMFL